MTEVFVKSAHDLLRPSRFQMFMEIAQVVAKRSTCMRNNVGAVVTQDHRIVSIGYNGSPPGKPHCWGNGCPGANTGCTQAIHAEMNALEYAPAGENMDLYVTLSPCENCYKAIVEDGRIKRLFFLTPYRIIDHVQPLPHLEIYRVTPAGYIMEWGSKKLVHITR